MTRTQRFDAAAVVLMLAIVTGLTFALRPQATETVTAAPSAATIDRPQAGVATHPSVLFIGDSYTDGNGLPEMSYGCLAAVRMGWVCDLAAVPGTGYISGGPANRSVVNQYIGLSTSFIERIPKLAQKYQPQIVIFDGGRNDLFPPRKDVFNAMVGTIAEARRAWPKATILVIRPRFLARPTDDLGFDDSFFANLRAQPGVANVVILDPITWFAGSDTADLLRPDGIHPNQRGERALALALVRSLTGRGMVATR